MSDDKIWKRAARWATDRGITVPEHATIEDILTLTAENATQSEKMRLVKAVSGRSRNHALGADVQMAMAWLANDIEIGTV